MGVAADGVPAHNAAADDGQEAGEDRDQRVKLIIHGVVSCELGKC
jgi:hypothetical protein